MDLSWMRDIDNLEQYLDKDLRLVYENCGIDVVISLLSGVPSINIYVSKASQNRAQEAYILEHFTGNNVKEIAVRIGCSEMQVYKVIKKNLENKSKAKPKNQVSLFTEQT